DVRTNLLVRLAPLGVDPGLLLGRLRHETDESARQALILALGEYRRDHLSAASRADLIPTLLSGYRDDPDPGVHSAIDWLLRQGKDGPVDRPCDWGQRRELERIDRERAGQPPEGRGWFVTRLADPEPLTFTIVRGPSTFLMGLPPWEKSRKEDD